jgi:NAD(P)H-dependent FMN reductase
MAALRLAIILGSTRTKRQGEKVALWFVAQAESTGTFAIDFIDLAQVDLDPVQSSHHPKRGEYSPGVTAFANRIAAADAFVLVTPEYNHGYPASLKRALDAVYAEWNGKPAAIVSYGGVSGGIRAAEQLRTVLAELRVADVRESVAIPRVGHTFHGDTPPDDPALDAAAQHLLAELRWWAEALAAQRAKAPYPG